MRKKLLGLAVTAMLVLGTGGVVAAMATDTSTTATAAETLAETAQPDDSTGDVYPDDLPEDATVVMHDEDPVATEWNVERDHNWQPNATTAETTGHVYPDDLPENTIFTADNGK